MNGTDRPLLLLAAFWLAGLILSGWAPHDRAPWLMEVAPVLIAWPLLFSIRHRFALPPLAHCRSQSFSEWLNQFVTRFVTRRPF